MSVQRYSNPSWFVLLITNDRARVHACNLQSLYLDRGRVAM
jgi:hypothetical protein